MRSPVIAFSLLAAVAVSPTLVSGAPASSPKLDNALARTENLSSYQVRSPTEVLTTVTDKVGDVTNTGSKHSDAVSPPATNVEDPRTRTEAMKKAKAQTNQPSVKAAAPPVAKMAKRAQDQYTAGGNAYSGAASDSSGGDVQNESTDGTLTNDDGSNPAGGAGSSFSGFAFGGNGMGHGPGGNAYSGATGASRGGNVINSSEDAGNNDADAIDNTTANNAGGGGFSESGSAEGGDAAGPTPPAGVRRRAGDNGTAGGNAYSGATSDVSGGSVVNSADDQGTITNDGGNTAGGAGTTFSGDADGGNGNGLGPGGNAYSGASGPAVGGGVYNYGGTINNAADSNAAGGGGVSETGDATGGRA